MRTICAHISIAEGRDINCYLLKLKGTFAACYAALCVEYHRARINDAMQITCAV